MEQKIESLDRNQTWELVDFLKDSKVIVAYVSLTRRIMSNRRED